jgi:ABC-type amino acid transport substrate-binding protein
MRRSLLAVYNRKLTVLLAALAIVALAFAAHPAIAQTAAPDAPVQKPALTVNPKKLNFGTVKAGSIKKKNITIRNASKTMTLNVMVFLPSVPPFVIVAGGGSFALLPKAKQVVTVQFAPPFQGVFNGFNVDIGSNDPLTPSVTVPLTGKANLRQKPPK